MLFDHNASDSDQFGENHCNFSPAVVIWYFVSGFWRKIQKFKNNFGHSIQSGPEGREMHVASTHSGLSPDLA